MTNTLLYIGAYIDLIPIFFFKDIKKFIFIDCVPFSNHGNQVVLKDDIMKNIYASIDEIDKYKDINEIGNKDFLPKLEKVMKQNDFVLIENNKLDSYLLYKNQDRTIKYYINRAFPEFLTKSIKEDIKKCNILYNSGYHPNKCVLDLMMKPTTFVGSSNTCYQSLTLLDEDFNTSIIRCLYENEKLINSYYILKMIKDYEYWKIENIIESNINNYKIIKCESIKDIEKLR